MINTSIWSVPSEEYGQMSTYSHVTITAKSAPELADNSVIPTQTSGTTDLLWLQISFYCILEHHRNGIRCSKYFFVMLFFYSTWFLWDASMLLFLAIAPSIVLWSSALRTDTPHTYWGAFRLFPVWGYFEKVAMKPKGCSEHSCTNLWDTYLP